MLRRLSPAILAAALTLPGPAGATEPPDTLLLNGSFELLEKGRPVGWELQEGARSGPGTLESEWFLGAPAHSGARSLRLAGEAGTASWLLLRSDPVPVEADRLVRLSAWMRTQEVRQEGRQWPNSNVGLAFEDADGGSVAVDGYPVANTAPLLGSHDWTLIERVVRVPEGAAAVRAICFLSLSGRAWFDDVAVQAVDEPDWIVTKTERFVFHEQDGVRLSPEERRENERQLAELEQRLGIRLPHPVLFYRYRDAEQKERVTGRGGPSHAELPGRLHSLQATDRHELVHLLTAVVGPPESVLFGEGLAVYLAGGHEGRPADEAVRELAAAGKLPPLALLTDWASFGELDRSVSFPVAGSFVGFLIDTGGFDAFKQLYPRHGRRSSPEILDERLRERYGAGLLELEQRWRAALLGS